MDVGASVRPGADGSAHPCLTWCGSFTVHGLGFHATRGTTTDFAMAWPIGNGGWQVLQDAYDIYDPIAGQDGYIEPEDLIDILGENGYSSLSSFVALEGKWWREGLTCAVAAKWCRERYSVPLTFADGHAALSRLVSCASAFYPGCGQGDAWHNDCAGDGLPGERLQHGRLRHFARAQGHADPLGRRGSAEFGWPCDRHGTSGRPSSPTGPESEGPRAQVRALMIEGAD